jgi:hypothetical protein
MFATVALASELGRSVGEKGRPGQRETEAVSKPRPKDRHLAVADCGVWPREAHSIHDTNRIFISEISVL